eukprot:6434862-Alexandrium_andersonii.AAC.1
MADFKQRVDAFGINQFEECIRVLLCIRIARLPCQPGTAFPAISCASPGGDRPQIPCCSHRPRTPR